MSGLIALLDVVTGVFFMLGLLWAAARVLLPPWDERLFPMVAWWVLGIVGGGMLTEPPPSSARLLTVVVPVCFFAAAAFSKTVALVQRFGWGLPATPALAVGVTLFAINSLYGYFVAFTPLRISGGQHAELATALSGTLQEVHPPSRVHFFGAPYMFADFPTFAFFSQRLTVLDVHETLERMAPGSVPPGDLFILMPHRTAEVRVLEIASPGGEVREIRSPVDGRVMATLFRARQPMTIQATGREPREGAARR